MSTGLMIRNDAALFERNASILGSEFPQVRPRVRRSRVGCSVPKRAPFAMGGEVYGGENAA